MPRFGRYLGLALAPLGWVAAAVVRSATGEAPDGDDDTSPLLASRDDPEWYRAWVESMGLSPLS